MKKLSLLLVMGFFLAGCAMSGRLPPKTQLQIRQFQTRSYETGDTKMVMKAMLNVLQDDGFIVKNAVLDLGLLSAEKTIDVKDPGEVILRVLLMGGEATWKNASVIECTANVSGYGSQTKVRVNFQRKCINNKGVMTRIEQIGDVQYYQNFFSKVSKGFFIQKERL